jgi:hypothetical protein
MISYWIQIKWNHGLHHIHEIPKKGGLHGTPKIFKQGTFLQHGLHVGTHSHIICPKLDNNIAYIKGQNIFPFSLLIETPKSFIHLGFNRQSFLHTLFEVFSMNSCECTNIDALPNSLMDSNVSLNWKQQKNKELGHAPWLATL